MLPTRLSFQVTCFVAGMLLLVTTLPGCGGCRKTAKTEQEILDELEKKKQAEKPKKDFSVAQLTMQPADSMSASNAAKPGHFVAATLRAKANNFDFKAELHTASVDRNGQPIVIPGTPFSVVMSRPAALPKGQQMNFESMFFVPVDTGQASKQVWLQNKLRASSGGREVAGGMHPTTRMPGEQYFFVVLSTNPDNYGYVKQLESVSPPFDDLLDEDRIIYYRVMLPKIENLAPVPGQPFAWTSIAYVLWDELHPDRLSTDQKRAMLDWIHWGGQLIVSGPGSMDALAGSFLAPYLPASKVTSTSLEQEDFDELNRGWSLAEKKTKQRHDLLVNDKALLGVELKKHADGHFVEETGNLVVERRVGRGRIVITAFPLNDRDVINWGSFDGFFNGCLLRRPDRVFEINQQYFSPGVRWKNYAARIREPRFISTNRYFSRDVGHSIEGAKNERLEEDWHLDGHQSVSESGVAGWNDDSGAAAAARQSLQSAAGISVPKAGFVLRVLAVYLLVLVPVNWGVFRLMGRVEWAWIAAPLIAIIGAFAVVKLAQLDIGFARSRTQVAILEIHGGYERAHLTRYTALYTSLSDTYELSFDDQSAVASPFAANAQPDRGSKLTVHLRRDQKVRLNGLQVDSNTTGMVHSEQMFDLGGSLKLEGDERSGFQINNGTGHSIKDVGLVRRNKSGVIETAWMGDLEPSITRPVQFTPVANGTPWLTEWAGLDAAPAGEADDAKADVSLTKLFRLAAERLRLRPGDCRLVGWSDELLEGLTIKPRASQTTSRMLVVAHLRFGELPRPVPDDNLFADVRRPTEDDDENALIPLPGKEN